MVLFPSRCELTQVLKGIWELQLEHPIDPDGRWKVIQENGIISAVTPQGTQLFTISNRKKSDEMVTAIAYPIFFDSADEVFMVDARPTNKTGQEALDIMLANQDKYTAKSDVTTSSTAYYVRKNLMEALNGDDENAFLNRWGGEPIYDNYNVTVNERAGGDYGVRVLYGKNLEGAEEEIDYSEIVTRMVPTSYNGYTLEGNEPWVDSPLINSYPKIYYKTVHFEDVKLTADSDDDEEETFDTMEELRAELVRRCNVEYEGGADKPKVTLDISLVDIAKTEEYKDYEVLEEIGLGDTLYCKHRELGIETEARAVEIIWDCIEEKVSSVVIGDYKEPAINSMLNAEHKVSQTITDEGDLRAERIAGMIDLMVTQLKCQQSVAQKQEVRAILFEDTDEGSDTYGAMCLGTQGFQIASARTTDNRDWDWRTFGTANGFMADLIIAGALYSRNYVQGSQGIKIDLDNGEILSPNFNVDANGNVSMTGKLKSSSVEISGGTIEIDGLSQDTYAIRLKNTASQWRANFGAYGMAFYHGNTAYGNSRIRIYGPFITLGSFSGDIDSPTSGSNRVMLDVSGNIYADNFSQWSDRDLKENIASLESEFARELINSLRPAEYAMKDDTEKVRRMGFIAQEADEAISSDYALVSQRREVEGLTTPMTIQYIELIAPMVSVLQQHEKKIEDLERRLLEFESTKNSTNPSNE